MSVLPGPGGSADRDRVLPADGLDLLQQPAVHGGPPLRLHLRAPDRHHPRQHTHATGGVDND